MRTLRGLLLFFSIVLQLCKCLSVLTSLIKFNVNVNSIKIEIDHNITIIL